MVNRFAFRKRLKARSAVAGLTSLLVSLKSVKAEPGAPWLQRARAVRDALWATNPAD